jgi:aquaporin Z
MWRRAREHWPEFLIEAWALGTFMISAGAFTVLIEHPDFGVPGVIESTAARRAMIGVAMGLTAIALIYSPWGRRSGAHMNPAVTFAFWRLGKVRGDDALWFVLAQFAGGSLGVLLVAAAFGARFSEPPVSFVQTTPAGGAGADVAFVLELLISFVLMLAVLTFSGRTRLAPYTGLLAGSLVATYIAIEAPYSGMSMNPARSFASAAAAGTFAHLWIYFVAPPLGMWLAAALYRVGGARSGCPKLAHSRHPRCIHCDDRPVHVPASDLREVSHDAV